MKRIILASILLVSLTACSAADAVSVNVSNQVNPIGIHGVDQLGNNITIAVDNATDALIMIQETHSQIHEGDMFSYCNTTDIANSGNFTILFVTPNNGLGTHIVFVVETEAEAGFQIWESANVSANGTMDMHIVNRNRTSANLSAVMIYNTPTLNSLGSMICDKHWGTGKGVGGEDRAAEEWLLKPNTKYIIRVTNFTTSANYASTELIWYQH